MSADWKSGDVAMTAKGTIALCHNGGRMIDQGGAPWSDDRFPDNLRPLVVIDPEDEQAVASLVAALHWDTDPSNIPATWRAQDALREFADPKPPKPEEPPGVGAVVEDDNGALWVRVNTRLSAPWRQSSGGHPGRFRAFADVPVVKVLSEGVSA